MMIDGTNQPFYFYQKDTIEWMWPYVGFMFNFLGSDFQKCQHESVFHGRRIYNVGPPAISWFINTIKYIVSSIMNHSYCSSVVNQLRYLGGPHCRNVFTISCLRVKVFSYECGGAIVSCSSFQR